MTRNTGKRGGRHAYSRAARQTKNTVEVQPMYQMDFHDTRKVRLPVEDAAAKAMLRESLASTWKSHLDKIDHYYRFSHEQLEFLRQYAKNRGNLLAAAIHAFGKIPVTSAQSRGANVLKLPFAQDLIEAFKIEEKVKVGLSIEDVAAWFEKIATEAMGAGDFANANRAMENYAKHLGMFVDRKEISHRNISSPAELDARIAELQNILREESLISDGPTIN